MKILGEAVLLNDEMDALLQIQERVELRAVRLLAHLLRTELPTAAQLELSPIDPDIDDSGKMVCGQIIDKDGDPFGDDIATLVGGHDLEWLAGLLTVGGAWMYVVSAIEDPNRFEVWMDIDKAMAIAIEGDEE